MINHFLNPRVTIAGDNFFNAANFIFSDSGMEASSWSACESATVALTSFVGGAVVRELVASSIASALVQSDGGNLDDDFAVLPVFKARGVLMALHALAGIEDLTGSKLTKPGTKWSETTTLAATGMYMQFAMVISEMCFVCSRLANASFTESGTSEDGKEFKVIDDNIVRLVTDIENRCTNLAELAKRFDSEDGACNAVVSATFVGSIVDVIMSWWINNFKKSFMAAALENIDADRISLDNRIPRYQHIVSKSRYNSMLAKAQLLGNPNRTALPPLLNSLHSFCASCSHLYQIWDFGAPAEEVALAAADASIDSAKAALHVIAAVNIIEEFSSQPKVAQDMAAKVLAAAGPDLPSILKEKLRHVARNIL